MSSSLALVLLAITTLVYGAIPAPRFYAGNSKEILDRDATKICPASQHSCLDINGTGLLSTDLCCPNSKYCVIDNSFQPSCCEIGSNCGLQCASSEYQCQATETISGTATVTASCCQRSCPSTSAYLCPSSLGGGCCGYDFACASGSCVSTGTPTSTLAPVVKTTCASSFGGGECSSGWNCAVVSNTNYCVAGSSSAVRTGPNGVLSTTLPITEKGGGLSTGAKAGIGGGIAGLALLVIGAVLYFCVLQRRKAKLREVDAMSSVAATSQVSGSKAGHGRPVPGRRQTADYFGPDAAVGPYTDQYSPTSPTSPRTMLRGVPIDPQGPGDIAFAVEIDSKDGHSITSPTRSAFEPLKKEPIVTEYPVEMP